MSRELVTPPLFNGFLRADKFFKTDGYKLQTQGVDLDLGSITQTLWRLGIDTSLSVGENQSVLHCCCGWGAVTEALIKWGSWFGFNYNQVESIDADPEVVREHRQNLPDIPIRLSTVEDALTEITNKS